MKKLLFACGAVALALSMASCDSKKSGEQNELTAVGDSISTMAGEASGLDWLGRYRQLPEEERAKFSKKEIVRGVEAIIMADTTDQGFLVGLQIGQQLMQQVYQMESAGIPVDHKAVLNEFRKAFNSDSVDGTQVMAIQSQLGQLRRRAFELAEKKREEEAAKAPEAVANVEAGEKYIKAAKEEDPSIVTTPSGLSYKVVKEGEGEPVGDARAVVNYKGRLVDGTEFDSGEGATFSAANVIPGFGEGLKMMQKGGVYTLIIPADIAYGAKAVGNIPPMSTLIFEVEVLDIAR